MSAPETGSERKDLLDDLQKQIGCPYLSSLHEPLWMQQLTDVVGGIRPDSYSDWAWRSTVEYITGAPCGAQSASEAKAELQAFLRTQRG